MMRVFLTVDTEISLPLSPGWEDMESISNLNAISSGGHLRAISE